MFRLLLHTIIKHHSHVIACGTSCEVKMYKNSFRDTFATYMDTSEPPPNDSIKVLAILERVFFRFKYFNYEHLISIFKFRTILQVMEMQLYVMLSASNPSPFRFAWQPLPSAEKPAKSTCAPRKKINLDGRIKLKAEPREFYYVATSELGLSY